MSALLTFPHPLRRPLRLAAFALALLGSGAASPASASDWWVADGDGWRWADSDSGPVDSIAIFGGEGTERNFSDTLENLFDYQGSSDRMIAISAGRRVAWFRDLLSLDTELFYARHFGRESYNEFGATAFVRWHQFPWNDHVRTSFAVGVGPSYTTIYPKLEAQNLPEDRSKILNQFNLELTLALPEYAETALIGRLQHRSSVFGLINGVHHASNFLTVGVRQEF